MIRFEKTLDHEDVIYRIHIGKQTQLFAESYNDGWLNFKRVGIKHKTSILMLTFEQH